jgi:quercetin dioxygenase-like cupin family protein
MNRREFTGLLPVLAATAAVGSTASAQQTAANLPAGADAPVASGVFDAFNPPEHFEGRSAHSFVRGMLPTGIGFEMHVSYLAPHAEHEPEEKHPHSEIWLMRQGTVEIHLNGQAHVLKPGDTAIAVAGTLHYVKNIGEGVASYFVVKAGNGPLGR